jgi:hypothetical protein
MKIELSEISGKIHFGVQKRASFISFLDEPYTRFSVTSEVGGQYKLKDIPRLSTMVIQKIKKYIRSKTVFPKAYKFRLMWPKKWWPEGEDEYKESTSASATTTTTATTAPTSGEAAPIAPATPAQDNTKYAIGIPAESSPVPVPSSAAPASPEAAAKQPQPPTRAPAASASSSGDVNTATPIQTSKSTGGNANDSSDDEVTAGGALHGKLPPQLAHYKHELDKSSSLWNRHYRRTFLGGSHSVSLSGEDFLEVEDRMIQLPSLSFLLETCQFRHGIRRRAMSVSNMSLMDEVLPASNTPLRLNSRIRMRSNSISDFRRMKYRETAYSRLLFDYGNLMRRCGYAAVRESLALSVRRQRSLSWHRKGHAHTIEHIPLTHSPGDVYKSCIPGRMRDISLPPDRETLQDICDTLGIPLVPVKPSKLRGAAKATSSLLSNFRLEDWSISKAAVTSNLSGFLGFFRAAQHNSEEGLSDDEVNEYEEDAISQGPPGDAGFALSTEDSSETQDSSGITTVVSESTSTPVVETPPKEAEQLGETVEHEPCLNPVAARLEKFSDLMQKNAMAMKKLMAHSDDTLASAYPTTTLSKLPAVERIKDASVSPLLSVDSTSDADLALRAREAALSAAFANEMPRLQSFLYVGKRVSSTKKWLVLRDGFIGVFDDPQQNTEFGSPRQVIDLLNAVCRPHTSDACCFELGLISNSKSSGPRAPSHTWITMWAESHVQCRAWIMGIQHSSQRRGRDFTSE